MNMHIWYSVVFNEFGTSKKLKSVRLCHSESDILQRGCTFFMLCRRVMSRIQIAFDIVVRSITQANTFYIYYLQFLLYKNLLQNLRAFFFSLFLYVWAFCPNNEQRTNPISLSSRAKQPIQIDVYINLSPPPKPPAPLLIIIFHPPTIDAVLISIVQSYIMSISLTSLPPELLTRIVVKIQSQASLYNLSLLSRHLHYFSIPHLYHSITIRERTSTRREGEHRNRVNG